jgi:copper chaperone CopZ
MTTLALRIDSMHCGSCVRRVATTLNALPGTHADEVRIGSARVTTSAPLEQIQQALNAAGYPATLEPVGA